MHPAGLEHFSLSGLVPYHRIESKLLWPLPRQRKNDSALALYGEYVKVVAGPFVRLHGPDPYSDLHTFAAQTFAVVGVKTVVLFLLVLCLGLSFFD